MYLVGAMQRADEEGDLLYHSQVLLQVLQLLEEARGPEIHLIWAEKRPNSTSGVEEGLTRTRASSHCKKDLWPWRYGTTDTAGNITRLSPWWSSRSTGVGDRANHRWSSAWGQGHTQRVRGGQKTKSPLCPQEVRNLHRASSVVGTAIKENSMCKGTVA